MIARDGNERPYRRERFQHGQQLYVVGAVVAVQVVGLVASKYHALNFLEVVAFQQVEAVGDGRQRVLRTVVVAPIAINQKLDRELSLNDLIDYVDVPQHCGEVLVEVGCDDARCIHRIDRVEYGFGIVDTTDSASIDRAVEVWWLCPCEVEEGRCTVELVICGDVTEAYITVGAVALPLNRVST